jgi:hypothetical protein
MDMVDAFNLILVFTTALVIVIFARYVWNNFNSLRKHRASLAALAIIIVLVGNSLRITVEELHLARPFFIAPTAITIVGKCLALYVFSPLRWRWWVLLVGVPACVAVPLLIFGVLR